MRDARDIVVRSLLAIVALGLSMAPSMALAGPDPRIAILVEGDGADDARRAVTDVLEGSGQLLADPRTVAAARVFREGPLDEALLAKLRSDLGVGALLAVQVRRQRESAYLLVLLVSDGEAVRRYDSAPAGKAPAAAARIASELISESRKHAPASSAPAEDPRGGPRPTPAPVVASTAGVGPTTSPSSVVPGAMAPRPAETPALTPTPGTNGALRTDSSPDDRAGVPAGYDDAIQHPLVATPAPPPPPESPAASATPTPVSRASAAIPKPSVPPAAANRTLVPPATRVREDLAKAEKLASSPLAARLSVVAVGGAKELSEEWGYYLRQGAEAGVLVDLMDSSQIVGATAGILFSRARAIGTGVDQAGLDIEEDTVLETWEPSVGVRLAAPMRYVRPFLGGGGTLIGVRRHYRATPEFPGDPAAATTDDRETAIGFWFDGGLEFLMGRRVTASVRVRRSSARLELQGREQDAGGWHGLAALGCAFGGSAARARRPAPSRPLAPAPPVIIDTRAVSARPVSASGAGETKSADAVLAPAPGTATPAEGGGAEAAPSVTPPSPIPVATPAPTPRPAIVLAPAPPPPVVVVPPKREATPPVTPTPLARPVATPGPPPRPAVAIAPASPLPAAVATPTKPADPCRDEVYLRLKSKGVTRLNSRELKQFLDLDAVCRASGHTMPTSAPPVGKVAPKNPCEDPAYMRLRSRDLDALSDAEYEQFRTLDVACDAWRLSGAASPGAARVPAIEPCADARYRALGAKGLDAMNDAEYEIFQRLDAACIEQQRQGRGSAP